METSDSKPVEKKMFLDVPHAAKVAGFSVRQFRRIIQKNRIPTIQIGRKLFILGRDFENWELTQKPRHLEKRG